MKWQQWHEFAILQPLQEFGTISFSGILYTTDTKQVSLKHQERANKKQRMISITANIMVLPYDSKYPHTVCAHYIIFEILSCLP